MSTISVSGFPKSDARIVSSHRNSRLRDRHAAAGATLGKHAKKFRRALPERAKEKAGESF
jgi:hypothetical protein